MAWWQFDKPGIIDDEISGANAKLIAAAPELLEAAKGVLQNAIDCDVAFPDGFDVTEDPSQFQQDEDGEYWNPDYFDLMQAIAKAEGN